MEYSRKWSFDQNPRREQEMCLNTHKRKNPLKKKTMESLLVERLLPFEFQERRHIDNSKFFFEYLEKVI